MTAADYRAAVARTPHGPEPGRLTQSPWGPELTRAMAEHGNRRGRGTGGWRPVGGPGRSDSLRKLVRPVVTLI
ncbi:DUF2399 domain-containing protein [Streptomyces sp. NPDC051636]|uniref:DUF2399 domain-containing protein n=1 Tax=Streptomyces sp. NPDC051636 TaxID=3365663 RepID=UPI0037B17CAA